MMILAQLRRPFSALAAGLLVLVAGLPVVLAGEVADPGPDEILALDLEDLLNIEVTSVSKRAQPQNDAAAAVYVVTGDDIRRSGATTIPDALRMVPGLHVARIDGNKWAVTSRGFNGRFSNKLLVLVDGRSVYTTLFSGVYWEVQDHLLEDVDRIEIIRGPGSTMWGANAVNGVINIITKHAADTQGGFFTSVVGSEERAIGGLRYGTDLGGGAYVRGYAKALARDGFVRPDGSDGYDDWSMLRGGFRLDYQRDARNAITIQGDVYDGDIRQETELLSVTMPYEYRVLDDVTVFGWNMLGRLQHTLSPTSVLTLQGYFSHDDRNESFEHETTDQADFDLQHGFRAGAHEVMWGVGHRRTYDDLRGLVGSEVPQAKRTYNLYSAFLQDQVPLFSDRLDLVIGTKLEHNDFTGDELQPSVRLMWRAGSDHRLWGAVSRADRTPSRMERDLKLLIEVEPSSATSPLPVAFYLQGGDQFGHEVLQAYELGYRFTHENLSLDAAFFLNEYQDLRAGLAPTQTIRPSHIELVSDVVTIEDGRSFGGELSAVWRMTPHWRWDLGYSFYRREFPEESSALTVSNELGPEHQVSLRSSLQPTHSATVDLWLRHVGSCTAYVLEDHAIEAYTTLDVRLGYGLGEDLDLSIVGQNLFDRRRFEYAPEFFTRYTEIERGYYVSLDWRF